MKEGNLSRRDFLKITGETAFGLLLTACSSNLPSTPTPTETPVPLIPEVHSDVITGLPIETYKDIPFKVITDQFPPEERTDIFTSLQKRAGVEDKEDLERYGFDVSSKTFFGTIRTDGLSSTDEEPRILVYYSESLGDVIEGFGAQGRDAELLDWPKPEFSPSPFNTDLISLTQDGLVLYRPIPIPNSLDMSPMILANIKERSKTVIYPEQPLDYSHYYLSASGNTLLRTQGNNNDFRYTRPRIADVDIVNIDDWSLKGHFSDLKLRGFPLDALVNGDGTKVMFPMYHSAFEIVDIATGETESTLSWSFTLDGIRGDLQFMYSFAGSPNFEYFAASSPDLASSRMHWLTLVNTPHGIETIYDPKTAYVVDKVLDDGTVIANKTWIIHPNNEGKYTTVTIDEKEYPLSLEGYVAK